MAIEEIVDVQISIEDAVVSRAGFGTGLIVGTSNKLSSKVESFTSPEAVAAVFTAGDNELTMANAYFGQEIRPEKLYIADRVADVKKKDNYVIASLQNAVLYTITIVFPERSNLTFNVAFTSDGSATRPEIVAGLIANIASQSVPVSTTDNGDDFDIENDVAGEPITITSNALGIITPVTALVNISTELALIEQQNNDWYALFSDSHVDLDIKRASAFIQSRAKIYGTSSQSADIVDSEDHVQTLDFDADFVTANVIDLDIDGIPITQVPFDTNQATTLANLATEMATSPLVTTATVTGARQITVTAENPDVLLVIDSIVVTLGASQAVGTVTTTIDPTTDLGAELKALTLDRTYLFYHTKADSEFPEIALAGGVLPLDPGSVTWKFKTLSLVTVDILTDTQRTKALANNVMIYTTIGSVNITCDGKMTSGRFIDIRRGVDKIKARQTENIFALLVTLPKVPYTNSGVAAVENEIRAVLNEGISTNILRADPAPVITVPLVSTISSTDRGNRLLPDMKWSAELAGAIHKVIVRGTVKV